MKKSKIVILALIVVLMASVLVIIACDSTNCSENGKCKFSIYNFKHLAGNYTTCGDEVCAVGQNLVGDKSISVNCDCP